MLFQQYSVRFRELPRSACYTAPRVDSVKNAASSGGIFMPKKAQKNARPPVENHGGRAFYGLSFARCKSVQRAAVWGTSRKSITGSALFAKSSVRMIFPRFVSKGISVCVPSGAMRTSFLTSSSPAGSSWGSP